MKNILLFSFLCLLFFSCNSDAENSSSEATESEQNNPEPAVEVETIQPANFSVNIENLRVRDQAGMNGTEVIRLPVGHQVLVTGEQSDFTSEVALRGVKYNEPWLKIKTSSGQEGWVYGGGIALESNSPLGKKLVGERFDRFFGEGTNKRLQEYLSNYHGVSNAKEFAQTYELGQFLVDTINYVLENKLDLSQIGVDEAFPDLSWLESQLPGFVMERVAEGTMYYFFKDFRQWFPLAQKTAVSEDDELLNLMVEVHPMDSVAYFFPSWFMQTWDYGGNSLLGKGIHFSVLKSVEELSGKTELFTQQLKAIKESLISDIIGYEEMGYEMPQSAILSELDQILSGGFSVLTKEDLTAIQKRRTQFTQPDQNGIRLNLRSGM